MKHRFKVNVICSIVFQGYRLELVQSITGKMGFRFWDGSHLVQEYTSPDNRTKAMSMMGAYLLEAIDDLERKEKEQCITKCY